jgi:hypothetical protein
VVDRPEIFDIVLIGWRNPDAVSERKTGPLSLGAHRALEVAVSCA